MRNSPEGIPGFRQNAALLNAFHGDQVGFQRMLDRALDRGVSRGPRTTSVLVHVDVFHDFERLNPQVRRFMDGLRSQEWQLGEPPVFLVNPIHRDALNDGSFDGWGYSPERTIVTQLDHSLGTGYMPLGALSNFFQANEGLHPEDRWVFHGGEWHACLTTAATQWTMLQLGEWWFHSRNPAVELLKNQQCDVLMEGLAGQKWSLPVEFGHVFDPQKISKIDGLTDSLRMARSFTTSTTQFYF